MLSYPASMASSLQGHGGSSLCPLPRGLLTVLGYVSLVVENPFGSLLPTTISLIVCSYDASLPLRKSARSSLFSSKLMKFFNVWGSGRLYHCSSKVQHTTKQKNSHELQVVDAIHKIRKPSQSSKSLK